MKKLVIVLCVVAVAFAAASALAQFGTLQKAVQGNVSGVVDDVKQAEKQKCEGEVEPYKDNIQYNAGNGGADKIQQKFGSGKISDKSATYVSGKINYGKYSYINFSCNTTNCSLYCYNN
jgi:hypothetical protein